MLNFIIGFISGLSFAALVVVGTMWYLFNDAGKNGLGEIEDDYY